MTVFAISTEIRLFVFANCSYQKLGWKKTVSTKSIHYLEDSFSDTI